MKSNLLFLLLVVFLVSCGSDDDGDGASVNLSLLYGQWFSTNSCPEQNNLIFTENGNYIHTSSGNSCDFNEGDTYQFTGNFVVNGNNILFNEQTMEVIEEGEVPSNPVGDFSTLIHQKIVVLTDTELLIERKFYDGNVNYFSNWHFEK